MIEWHGLIVFTARTSDFVSGPLQEDFLSNIWIVWVRYGGNRIMVSIGDCGIFADIP